MPVVAGCAASDEPHGSITFAVVLVAGLPNTGYRADSGLDDED
jgi:hypothetical protein